MPDTLGERRGANTKNIKKTNVEFRVWRKELKEKLLSNVSTVTSEYFHNFDDCCAKFMNDKQYNFLRIAASVALNSQMNHKHGAIIVYKKNIISSGFNYCIGDLSIHAEVHAISKLKGKERELLNECDLYVVRIGTGQFKNVLKYSKPCYDCQNLICKKGIKKIYYSTNYDYDITIKNYLESKKEESK